MSVLVAEPDDGEHGRNEWQGRVWKEMSGCMVCKGMGEGEAWCFVEDETVSGKVARPNITQAKGSPMRTFAKPLCRGCARQVTLRIFPPLLTLMSSQLRPLTQWPNQIQQGR